MTATIAEHLAQRRFALIGGIVTTWLESLCFVFNLRVNSRLARPPRVTAAEPEASAVKASATQHNRGDSQILTVGSPRAQSAAKPDRRPLPRRAHSGPLSPSEQNTTHVVRSSALSRSRGLG